MDVAIYAITHTPSGRRYIGVTARPMSRLREHRRALRLGIHANKRLQAAWQADGPEAFTFAIIETCPLAMAAACEEFYILYGDVFNKRAAKTPRGIVADARAAWQRTFGNP